MGRRGIFSLNLQPLFSLRWRFLLLGRSLLISCTLIRQSSVSFPEPLESFSEVVSLCFLWQPESSIRGLWSIWKWFWYRVRDNKVFSCVLFWLFKDRKYCSLCCINGKGPSEKEEQRCKKRRYCWSDIFEERTQTEGLCPRVTKWHLTLSGSS